MSGPDVKQLGLPKRLYYVKIVGTLSDDVVPLRWQQKGGGKYTSKSSALSHIANLRRINKLDARLFESQELSWTEIES
jgi:hypothetical protein